MTDATNKTNKKIFKIKDEFNNDTSYIVIHYRVCELLINPLNEIIWLIENYKLRCPKTQFKRYLIILYNDFA